MTYLTSFIDSNNKRQPIRWSQRKRVLERDKSTCQYCGDLGDVLDRIIPYAYGGSDHDNNLITACSWCNSRLSDKFFDDGVDGKRLYISERLHLKSVWFRKRHSICGDCKAIFRPLVSGATNILCAECYKADCDGVNGSVVPETKKEREQMVERWNSMLKEEESEYDAEWIA